MYFSRGTPHINCSLSLGCGGGRAQDTQDCQFLALFIIWMPWFWPFALTKSVWFVIRNLPSFAWQIFITWTQWPKMLWIFYILFKTCSGVTIRFILWTTIQETWPSFKKINSFTLQTSPNFGLEIGLLFPASRSKEGELLNSPSSVHQSVHSHQITQNVFVRI